MKIMFICTGNICRSVMAEALLVKRLKELGKKDEVHSCGIMAEDGDGATYHTIEAMEEYDINVKGYRATNIQNSQIKEMDLILCATNPQKIYVKKLYPELVDKIFTLKEYVGYQDKKNEIDLSDPWGYDIQTYRRCAEDISICIEMLVQKLYQIY